MTGPGGWGRGGGMRRPRGFGRLGRGAGRRGWNQRPTEPTEPWMQQLVGTENTVEEAVVEAATAKALGSGDVAVLATPSLMAIVERAAVAAVQAKLPSGQTTVGNMIQIQHVAPSPVGAKVRAQVRIEKAEGRRLVFAFRVSDAGGEVARGRHARVVVDRAQFEQQASARPR